MKIDNAIKQLQYKAYFGDENNANSTAIRALQEWQEISEEAGRVAIKDRDDLLKLIEKHVKRIERG